MNTEIKLTNDIYSVGVIDNRPVPFHRLTLEKGTTYNSYLLKTQKPTIIDTVDLIYTKDFLNNLKELIDLKDVMNNGIIIKNPTIPKIKYIILSAVGSLPLKSFIINLTKYIIPWGIINIEPSIAISPLMLNNFLVIVHFVFIAPANITKIKNPIAIYPFIVDLSRPYKNIGNL